MNTASINIIKEKVAEGKKKHKYSVHTSFSTTKAKCGNRDGIHVAKWANVDCLNCLKKAPKAKVM